MAFKNSTPTDFKNQSSSSYYVECIPYGYGENVYEQECEILYCGKSITLQGWSFINFNGDRIVITKTFEDNSEVIEVYSNEMNMICKLSDYHFSSNDDFLPDYIVLRDDDLQRKYLFSLEHTAIVYEFSGRISKKNRYFVIENEIGYSLIDQDFKEIFKTRFEEFVDINEKNNLMISKSEDKLLFSNLSDFTLKKEVVLKDSYSEQHYIHDDFVVYIEDGRMFLWQPLKNRLVYEFERSPYIDDIYEFHIDQSEEHIMGMSSSGSNSCMLTWNISNGSLLGNNLSAKNKSKIRDGYSQNFKSVGYLSNGLIMVDYDDMATGSFYTVIDEVEKKKIYSFSSSHYVINRDLKIIVSNEMKLYPIDISGAKTEHFIKIFNYGNNIEQKILNATMISKISGNEILAWKDKSLVFINLITMATRSVQIDGLKSALFCESINKVYALSPNSGLWSINTKTMEPSLLSSDDFIRLSLLGDLSKDGRYVIFYGDWKSGVRTRSLFDVEKGEIVSKDQRDIKFYDI